MTNVKGYTRNVNGQIQYVDAYSREQGSGYTRDGQRKNRAQREFLLVLAKRAKRGDAKAAARLAKLTNTTTY
jgi:hypothetical protein